MVSQAARLDVFEICQYLDAESGGRELADKFCTVAISTFEKLIKTPGLGRPRHFKKWPGANLRSWRIKGFPNYLIFYRQVANGVEIVRVIHGARDLEEMFNE